MSGKITGFRKALYDSGYVTGEKKKNNSGKETHDHENKQMIYEKKICIQTKEKIA
jgi:hypothetical protein